MAQQPAPTQPTPQPGDRILITRTDEPVWEDEHDTDGQEAELVRRDSAGWYEVRLDSGETMHVYGVRVVGEAWLRYERDLARHAFGRARRQADELRKERDGYEKIVFELGRYVARNDIPQDIKAALRKIRNGDAS